MSALIRGESSQLEHAYCISWILSIWERVVFCLTCVRLVTSGCSDSGHKSCSFLTNNSHFHLYPPLADLFGRLPSFYFKRVLASFWSKFNPFGPRRTYRTNFWGWLIMVAAAMESFIRKTKWTDQYTILVKSNNMHSQITTLFKNRPLHSIYFILVYH